MSATELSAIFRVNFSFLMLEWSKVENDNKTQIKDNVNQLSSCFSIPFYVFDHFEDKN